MQRLFVSVMAMLCIGALALVAKESIQNQAVKNAGAMPTTPTVTIGGRETNLQGEREEVLQCRGACRMEIRHSAETDDMIVLTAEEMDYNRETHETDVRGNVKVTFVGPNQRRTLNERPVGCPTVPKRDSEL